MFVHASRKDLPGAYPLRRLFMLRSFVILSQFAVISYAVFGLGMPLPLAPIAAVMAAYILFNMLTLWRLRSRPSESAGGFLLQLTLDVAALAALLYFSGGSTNPFVSLFLLHLVIAATTLPRRHAWVIAAVTLACYTLLMRFYMPLPHTHAMHGSDFSLHVLGMWFSFLLAVGLIMFFVVAMADQLRQRDRKLAEIREKALRDEHVVALGTLAAGAVHELATPLSTMAVLAGELAHDYAGNRELTERLGILRSQVERCKATLAQMNASAGHAAGGGDKVALDAYLNATLAQWQSLNPGAELHAEWQGDEPVPMISVDETLTQAIVSLLNNAAEVSPDAIEVEAKWSGHELKLAVQDRGPGLSEEQLAGIGRPFFTTKAEGLGLGLFLTQAVAQRLGGELRLGNRDGGGARVAITLPLAKLAA